MPTTTHELTGDFFLFGRAVTALMGEQRVVVMPVRQAAPQALFPSGLVARWAGPEACAFFDAHQAELRPGRGLRLTLHHLRASALPAGAEITARVERCELLPLPPSWLRKQPGTSQPGATQTATA